MNIDKNILFNNEKIIYSLRKIFCDYGYQPYKMKKFEEYSIYSGILDYLPCTNVITFTDTNGKIMALKPDVTLSIVRNFEDKPNDLTKVCYNENVYRIFKGTGRFKESSQVGLECLGNVSNEIIAELIVISQISLNELSQDNTLVVSNLDVVKEFVDRLNPNNEQRELVLKLIKEKNIDEIKKLNISNATQKSINNLIELCKIHCSFDTASKQLVKLGCNKNIISNFETIADILKTKGLDKKIKVDFTIANDMVYYNGFVFKGYLKNIPTTVLAGGEYINLMRKMNKKSNAIGMAVFLDFIEYLD